MREGRTAEAAGPLRHPRLWWTLGWVLLLGVCVGSLLPGPQLAELDVGDKWLHAGSYFVLMVWFGGLYDRGRQVLVAFLLVLLGLGLDVLQGGTATRTFDWLDVAANAGGVLAGLALTSSVLSRWCHRVEALLPI
jgi:hypothetical protein